MTSTSTPKPVAYDTAVSRGLAAVKSLDKAQWVIGDLALTVDTSQYGSGTVQRFSDDIGVAYKTVMDFRKVAERYAKADRSDLNKWTVHQIFAGQDDRAELVKSRAYTTAEARELVKSRKDDGQDSDGQDSDGQDSDGQGAEVDERARLAAEVDRLRGELLKAEAALAKYDAEHPQAPKVTMHSIKGIPQHAASEPRTDCPECKAAGVTPMPAPRRSRTRKAA